MAKLNIKGQNGFTGVDAMVAILIVIASVSVITSLSYQIYLNIEAIKRNANASSYAISIMEKVDELYYDDINEQNLQLENIPTGYTIETTIEDYNSDDLVKTIQVNVKYSLNNKEQVITMKKIKAREILITPNKPELDESMIPVKYINSEEGEYWKIITENEVTWYNYENGIWAAAVNKNQEGIILNQETKKIEGNPVIYYWIPRYSYKNKNIQFLYGTSENYVDRQNNSIGKLKDTIENGYIILEEFEGKKGIWTLQNSTKNIYQILNSSQCKKIN